MTAPDYALGCRLRVADWVQLNCQLANDDPDTLGRFVAPRGAIHDFQDLVVLRPLAAAGAR